MQQAGGGIGTFFNLMMNPGGIANNRDNRSNLSSTLYDFMREGNEENNNLADGGLGGTTTNLVTNSS